MNGNRRVTRTEHDGSSPSSPTIQGKRLNSPNDVVVRSDGSIWFTDPAYGSAGDYEATGQRRIGVPPSIALIRDRWRRLAADDFDRPMVCVSLDETRRNHRRHQAQPHSGYHATTKELGPSKISPSALRGLRRLRLDGTGRVWAGVGEGVHCFDPDGTLIGKLHLPEAAANLAFGGLKRNHMFITATTSLYSIRLKLAGAPTVASR